MKVTKFVVTVEIQRRKEKQIKRKWRTKEITQVIYINTLNVWVYMYVKYSCAHAEVALDGNQIWCHYQFSLSEIIYKTICVNSLTLLSSFKNKGISSLIYSTYTHLIW